MFKKTRLALLFVVIWLIIAPNVQAQEGLGMDIRVSQVSTLETPEALIMKAYFNVYDPKTNLSLVGVAPEKAEINLHQYNYSVSVPVVRPDVPIYIVLVLDASGSMSGLATELKNAAKSALKDTPANSYFAVVQFDEEIKLLQDFTQNIPAVTYAIDQYEVKRFGGTCLYDATYSSIEALLKAPVGRRAAIVFTDGQDEKIDGKQCSKRNFNEVMNLAMDNQVPINTIGLSLKDGDLNEVELKGWASSSGGISVIVRQDDLSNAFASIMDSLKSQWMVQAEIYPRRGENQVLLTVMFSETQHISKGFSITSNTDYPGPPSKVRVQLNGFVLNAVSQSYDVQLSLTSPELVKYVKIEVWDKSVGSKIGEYPFEKVETQNALQIPTSTLTINRSYYLVISAISISDNTPFEIARTDNKPVKEIRHEFVFDPSSAFPTLLIQAISQQNFDLGVNFSLSNPSLVAAIDGWLVDQNTNTKVEGSDFKIIGSPQENRPLIIPLRQSRVPSGKYTLVLRVLAKDGGIYSEDVYKDINYRAPTLVQRLLSALVANPVFLIAILVAILGLVLFLMLSTSRQKQLSGTPVMSGEMGKKLKAISTLPVTADESIHVKPVQPQKPEIKNPPNFRATMGNTTNAIASAKSTKDTPKLRIKFIEFPADVDGQFRDINHFPAIIGRVEGEIKISEKHLSRKHAVLNYEPGQKKFTLTDLDSRNGTYVNTNKITPSQPIQISDGSIIRLGTKIVIQIDVL